MKLGDALEKYRGYNRVLTAQKSMLTAQLQEAEKNAKLTGDSAWSEQAATLQLSIDETDKKYEENKKVLNGLIGQHVGAWNLEVAKQQADAQEKFGAEMGKIMTTVARMCAGDKVPASDEKKVMDYNSDIYMKAKQAQIAMAAIKKRQKEYDTLWEEEEAEEQRDPKDVADNTTAGGELPDISLEGGVEAVVEMDASIDAGIGE